MARSSGVQGRRRTVLTNTGAFPIISGIGDEVAAAKQWLVHGILAVGEVSAVIAPPTAGKSVLALDLACTIAAGTEWFGRRVVRSAALYFAPERASVTIRRRRAFENYHETGRLNVGIVRNRLDIIDRDDFGRVMATVKAFEDQTNTPVRFIAFDTARAVTPGRDENNPKDNSLLAHAISRVRDSAPAAHVMVLHHTPKGRPNELSGHTALTAMVDVIIGVTTSKGDRRSWRVLEANDLPHLPPAALFELSDVSAGLQADGEQMTAPVVVPIEKRAGEQATANGNMLPGDAQTALTVLKDMCKGGIRVEYAQWRDQVFVAYGERSKQAKKQALSSARKLLRELIVDDGEFVSVRMPSE